MLAAFRGPPALLVAIADAGDVFRSTDQGQTWTRTGCCATDIDPGDPARLIGHDADGALARSTDGGATWQPITPLTGPLAFGAGSTFDGPRLWAESFTGAVSFSDDFGTTWQVAVGIPDGGMTATPGVPGTLWIQDLRSTDDGAHWLRTGPVDDPTCFTEPTPVASDPLVTWALSCGAAHRTSALAARGLPRRLQFEDDNIGLTAAGGRGRTIAIEVNNFGTDRLGVSNDGGRTFHRFVVHLGFDRILIDAVDGKLMLGLDFNQRLYRSRDGGRTFRAVRGKIVAFAVDPRRRGVWYAARLRRLSMTRDAGRTWQRMTDPPGGRIRALDTGAGRLWALTESGVSSQPLPRVAP